MYVCIANPTAIRLISMYEKRRMNDYDESQQVYVDSILCRRFRCMKWAEKEYVDHAPVWCSVDLRDGNQALVVPMSLEQKVQFFKLLVKIGFKEIEVGFPAASETEYQFLRTLIEQDLIPDDVTIQVLTQAREHIIRKTFEALEGCKACDRACIQFHLSGTARAGIPQVKRRDSSRLP